MYKRYTDIHYNHGVDERKYESRQVEVGIGLLDEGATPKKVGRKAKERLMENVLKRLYAVPFQTKGWRNATYF